MRQAIAKAVQAPEFKTSMDKVQVPINYKDADEFKTWWDAEAVKLAEVIKKIGRVESK
ncbi:MAG: hypothetical protein HYU41_19140 [Candidatus Rokubacteria bacterium]|nr:hypothetical protein [Candidatus Rokubacteria bacterium]